MSKKIQKKKATKLKSNTFFKGLILVQDPLKVRIRVRTVYS